jgi:hypothetical protein
MVKAEKDPAKVRAAQARRRPWQQQGAAWSRGRELVVRLEGGASADPSVHACVSCGVPRCGAAPCAHSPSAR